MSDPLAVPKTMQAMRQRGYALVVEGYMDVVALAQYGIAAQARADAPGVYVDGNKIASLGLRVRRRG